MNAGWSAYLKLFLSALLGWVLSFVAQHTSALPVDPNIAAAIGAILPLISGLVTGAAHAATSPLSTSAQK